MNRTTLLRFAVLCIVLAALGIGAAAQDALPLPRVGGQTMESRFSASPDLLAPADMAEMLVYTQFQWLDTGAIKYKLVFTEVATGINHVQKVAAAMCNGTSCNFTFGKSAFFDSIRDAMQLTWKVVAIMEDGKLVSGSRTVTVNEVVTPNLDNPANGASIGYTGELSWTNANAINDYFRLVIIDPATGAKALNLFVDAQSCNSICAIAPRYFTDKLVVGQTYRWSVVAIGLSGERAKSDKRMVTIN